jgi:hypothetical protein
LFEKDETKDFNKKCGTKDGLQYICKECDSIRAKLLYETNKDHYKKLISARKKRYTKELNYFIVQYLLVHPCIDCGESDIRCLDFDHVRGEKFKNISLMKGQTYSLDNIKSEIEKCEVRCANCHRKKTCTDQNWYKNIEP